MSGPGWIAYKRRQRADYEARMDKQMSDDERDELVEKLTAMTEKDYSDWTKWMLANEAARLGIRPLGDF